MHMPHWNLTRGTEAGRRPMIQFAYWAGIIVLLACLKSAHYFDSDEGLILEGAWGLLHGRELYTNAFQFVPPGSFYAVSWIWRLFGPDYVWAKLLGAGSILLTAVAIFRTGMLVGGKGGLVYIPPVVYCLASAAWPAVNHNTFNAALMAWAVFFCLRAMAAGLGIDFIAAGLLTGLSALFLLHKAVALFVAVCLFFLFSGRRDGAASFKGVALYGLCFLVPLTVLLKWPVPMIFHDLVEFPLRHYQEVNRVSHAPLVAAALYVGLLLYMLRDGLTREVRLLFTVQVALLATSLQRTDWSHTLILLFPILSLAPVAYEKASAAKVSRVRCYVYNGAAISAVVFSATWAAVSLRVWPPFYDEPGGRASPLMAYVERNCPSIYAGPFMPGLYYETRRVNPTAYSVLLTGLNTRRQFAQARVELEAAMPRCAVVNYAMVKKFRYDENNPVDAFIRTNYEPTAGYGEVQVYRLRDSLPATPIPAYRPAH
jgi:hypothetical protein